VAGLRSDDEKRQSPVVKHDFWQAHPEVIGRAPEADEGQVLR
jgi:hypothetical protein